MCSKTTLTLQVQRIINKTVTEPVCLRHYLRLLLKYQRARKVYFGFVTNKKMILLSKAEKYNLIEFRTL